MGSTNQSPEYIAAEKKYLLAQTDEERLECLEEMLKHVPKHKAGESMRANLRTRHKKLRQSIEKSKKAGKSGKIGIKKEPMQVCIIGFPNTGKSSIFNVLTNQNSKVSPHEFTTYQPELGTMKYEDVNIQLIDLPPFPNHDQSIVNTTDILLITINSINQAFETEEFLKKSNAEKIYIYNKSDQLSEKEKRKIKATLKSKLKNKSFLFSSKNPENSDELKKEIFKSFPVIRIYTKEPRKTASKKPLILKKDSTVKDVAEKILKGLSKKTKKAKITGPSAKFIEQTVGLEHILKDKDIVELKT